MNDAGFVAKCRARGYFGPKQSPIYTSLEGDCGLEKLVQSMAAHQCYVLAAKLMLTRMRG
jgi:hypothetical protein